MLIKLQQFVYILNTCCKIKRFKSTFYQVFSSLKIPRKSAVSTKKKPLPHGGSLFLKIFV